jgi:hypothetical protein
VLKLLVMPAEYRGVGGPAGLYTPSAAVGCAARDVITIKLVGSVCNVLSRVGVTVDGVLD